MRAGLWRPRFLPRSSFARLLEISQVRGRLVPPGRHQEAIRTEHVVFLVYVEVVPCPPWA
jgi:hypothetical protein